MLACCREARACSCFVGPSSIVTASLICFVICCLAERNVEVSQTTLQQAKETGCELQQGPAKQLKALGFWRFAAIAFGTKVSHHHLYCTVARHARQRHQQSMACSCSMFGINTAVVVSIEHASCDEVRDSGN